MPISGIGATGQVEAEGRATKTSHAFGATLWRCPLTLAHAATLEALERGSGLSFDGWSAGQLLSAQRTPALYGAAALLRAHGDRAVVVGTTNRDEGTYLGFFGKASDGMVDLQPLSDLHKSEVRALAALLGVPAEVCDAPPSGDVWNGRTDLEIIGASYDEVEMVIRLKELERDPQDIAKCLSDDGAASRLAAAARAVERLHEENRHKYRVGSPAAHLDVLPRRVPGGWPDEELSGRWSRSSGERSPGETANGWST